MFFSRASPNLAMVLPTMDHINKVFTTCSLDPTYSPPIHEGLGMAKKTLNHYYSRTDDSHLYCIAIGKLLTRLV